MKRHFQLIASMLVSGAMLAAFSGCGKHSANNFIYMPDMVYSPALEAQKAPMRVPPKGTVPRDFQPYHFAKDQGDAAGRELKNPLPRSKAVLIRGQAQFNTYCIACHGPNGMGDGTIVPRFPRPPSLQSDKVRNWPDGNIYHVISQGQNLMPSYASQISQPDRWAIIHYVRVLQRAQHPSPDDLKAADAAGVSR